jgi:amidohydrolase
VAIRADIDALRMQDRKSTEYASGCPGVAHACGHDAHTTVVLATAGLLTTLAHRLPESEVPSAHVRFIFQAAEETAQGAHWMVEDGALRGVTSILGLHVDPTIPAGKVGIRYGVLTAQVDEVLIEVQEKEAMPRDRSIPAIRSAPLRCLYRHCIRRCRDEQIH